MLWSRFILILMLALVSARPSPELSLEQIEKELEQLTAKENDASETKKTSDQEDTVKNTLSESPKEVTADKERKDSLAKLEALDKSVTNAEHKKDETEKTEAETEKKTTDTSADAAVLPKKSVKTVLEELAHRDTTDADIKSDSSMRALRQSFKDTAAYRRLAEADSRLPSLPKLRSDGYRYGYPSPPKKPHYFPEAPVRRTYDFHEAPIRRTYDSYRKAYDDPPHDYSSWNRRGFLPNSDPVEALRGVTSEMTRAERMALSRGTWLPDNEPIEVKSRLPLPVQPDADARLYNDVHKQLKDNDTEDLIHGKTGMTDLEKRKRYLMDLLAAKLKSRVNEAQKRGLKIPTKIMDFLWNYESRRGLDTQSDKNRLSH